MKRISERQRAMDVTMWLTVSQSDEPKENVYERLSKRYATTRSNVKRRVAIVTAHPERYADEPLMQEYLVVRCRCYRVHSKEWMMRNMPLSDSKDFDIAGTLVSVVDVTLIDGIRYVRIAQDGGFCLHSAKILIKK